MIMDGSKEQNLGDFARKLRDAGCHRKQIESHSPWMNLCEGEICELKRGSNRKMLNRNVPKKLWDHCLELKSIIRSAATLPRFDLDHYTPEAKMHGMYADISDICEFDFYEWVMFNESQATFPATKFQVERWLGPALDVGSALTYKILKSNGQVVPRSTIIHLTLDELTNPDHIAMIWSQEFALLPRYPVLTLTTRPLKSKCMACILTSVTYVNLNLINRRWANNY